MCRTVTIQGTGTGKRYLRVYIQIRFRHACHETRDHNTLTVLKIYEWVRCVMPTWLGIHQKVMSLLATFKNTHFRITIPIKGCSSFICCKAWRHDSESVKIIYLDATESLIYTRVLMIAQTSDVNMDAGSANLMKITVSDCSTSHKLPIP